MMASVGGKNTKPERVVRRYLHRLGFRFGLHAKRLPGRPDVVLPKYRTVVFVHGCFWHHHPGCRYAIVPKTRREFWLEKFEKNAERDARNISDLKSEGWEVIVVWECQTRSVENLASGLEPLLERKRQSA